MNLESKCAFLAVHRNDQTQMQNEAGQPSKFGTTERPGEVSLFPGHSVEYLDSPGKSRRTVNFEGRLKHQLNIGLTYERSE